MHLMGALQGIPKKQIPFPRHHSGPGTGALGWAGFDLRPDLNACVMEVSLLPYLIVLCEVRPSSRPDSA